MTVSRFTTGGFVAHCVPAGKCAYSAWFDGSGRLLDCERTRPTVSAVPGRHNKVRARLAAVGRALAAPRP